MHRQLFYLVLLLIPGQLLANFFMSRDSLGALFWRSLILIQLAHGTGLTDYESEIRCVARCVESLIVGTIVRLKIACVHGY
jgi:hypothetical protein